MGGDYNLAIWLPAVVGRSRMAFVLVLKRTPGQIPPASLVMITSKDSASYARMHMHLGRNTLLPLTTCNSGTHPARLIWILIDSAKSSAQLEPPELPSAKAFSPKSLARKQVRRARRAIADTISRSLFTAVVGGAGGKEAISWVMKWSDAF